MKILVVQLAFLGDIILSTPVIQGVKELYPNSDVWLLTTPLGAEIFHSDESLAGVIKYDKRKEYRGLRGTWNFAQKLKQHNFDLIISVHKSYRTAMLLKLVSGPKKIGFSQAKLSFLYDQQVTMVKGHAVERVFSILQFHPRYSEIQPQLQLGIKDLANELRDSIGLHRPYVVLAPGSVWETKRWPARYYRQVAEAVQKRGLQAVIIGSKDEQPLADQAMTDGAINLAGKLKLGESLAVVKSASALVCNDSMVLHAASTFKVPTVAIFCATSPSYGFGPWKNKAIVVEREDLSCKPCSPHGAKVCPLKTNACMDGLLPEKVIQALDTVLT